MIGHYLLSVAGNAACLPPMQVECCDDAIWDALRILTLLLLLLLLLLFHAPIAAAV
jgi:hypothetical protein